MPGPAPLLCVGFQRGVLPALRALGRPALALVAGGAPRPDAPELDGVREIDLHGVREPITDVARALLDGRTPAAVVALAERTVLVAARLREAFALAGNDPGIALRCADKVEMKRAMDAAGLPVAPWREVRQDSSARELVGALGLPIVLKPRRDSGGRGQCKLLDEASLAAALARHVAGGGFEEGYGWLAEGWLDGVEMSIESFVHAGRPSFQSPTEYFVPRHANIVPAQLTGEEWRALSAFNTRALSALQVERGITHLELFLTAAGPVFGELAIRPPGGRLMTLLRRAWGFDPWEAMLRLELGEGYPFPLAPERTAGVFVLHPGSGRVTNIRGLEEARALPHVRRIALKVAQGHSITERMGTGQDIGSIHAEGPDRDAVAAALSAARERLEIGLG
jgi:biotin carboxylase